MEAPPTKLPRLTRLKPPPCRSSHLADLLPKPSPARDIGELTKDIIELGLVAGATHHPHRATNESQATHYRQACHRPLFDGQPDRLQPFIPRGRVPAHQFPSPAPTNPFRALFRCP